MFNNIWQYSDHRPEEEARLVATNDPFAIPEFPVYTIFENDKHLRSKCDYCTTTLATLGKKYAEELSPDGDGEVFLQVCPACGWWIVTGVNDLRSLPMGTGSAVLKRGEATLKNLDLSDVSVPTAELARYLVARYEDRFDVHPKKYEEVVAGVFSDFGYRVRVTTYSRDKGLDVIVLDGDGGEIVGIQVKRYKGKIEAEQIRALAGALLQDGLTTGIFITTSSFTKGARQIADALRYRRFAITLWDASTFYDKLRLSQRPPYTKADDESAPYYPLWKDPVTIPTLYSATWGAGHRK